MDLTAESTEIAEIFTLPRSSAGTGGFTLLELLIIIFLIGIISAVALPRMIMPRQEQLPVILKSCFEHAFTRALISGKEVKLSFEHDKIKVLDMTYDYPEGIILKKEKEVLFYPEGFSTPQEIIFYKGAEKLEVQVGLFGITEQDS
ncbi:hypothetical protein BuS5_03685 [Desulfosarcina sp. BuS5]|uniref:hypothetical protein n=1 Tax=Desulfosarcina sp. BuS5 TaxID=933262 RepID=UPI000482271B|nr:hypothetical protein [Desulfosarcina sp. BuS5]WDN90714.1 hypothetical protein BuS5_03685 [Desulfosarcina sp. BuS5]